jgi:hypothetical protein
MPGSDVAGFRAEAFRQLPVQQFLPVDDSYKHGWHGAPQAVRAFRAEQRPRAGGPPGPLSAKAVPGLGVRRRGGGQNRAVRRRIRRLDPQQPHHPTRKRPWQNPNLASIYCALAEHEKRQTHPEAVAQTTWISPCCQPAPDQNGHPADIRCSPASRQDSRSSRTQPPAPDSRNRQFCRGLLIA